MVSGYVVTIPANTLQGTYNVSCGGLRPDGGTAAISAPPITVTPTSCIGNMVSDNFDRPDTLVGDISLGAGYGWGLTSGGCLSWSNQSLDYNTYLPGPPHQQILNGVGHFGNEPLPYQIYQWADLNGANGGLPLHMSYDATLKFTDNIKADITVNLNNSVVFGYPLEVLGGYIELYGPHVTNGVVRFDAAGYRAGLRAPLGGFADYPQFTANDLNNLAGQTSTSCTVYDFNGTPRPECHYHVDITMGTDSQLIVVINGIVVLNESNWRYLIPMDGRFDWDQIEVDAGPGITDIDNLIVESLPADHAQSVWYAYPLHQY